MQLGNILSSAREPLVCKPVKFQVLAEDERQLPVKATAEAVLAFVSEEAREESRRYAREYLEQHDYKGKPIPGDVLDEEEDRWFLLHALRDKDDPSRMFCTRADYPRFRKALIAHQKQWLFTVYAQFVRDEYPELATPRQQKELEDEAKGK